MDRKAYRFDKLEFFPLVDLLQAENVLETRLAEVALLHLQDRIRLTRSDINT